MREGSISFEKGVFTYDRDAAVKSGESEEILKIADIAFAYLQKSMDNRKDMSKKQGENIKKTRVYSILSGLRELVRSGTWKRNPY